MDTTITPQVIDGIDCYAPEMAFSNEDYSPEAFERLYKAEHKNFWFKSRKRIFHHIIGKLAKKKTGDFSFIEIGCGTGFILKGLSDIPNLIPTGADVYIEGLKITRERLKNVKLVQLNAVEMPFSDQFDAVGAFDVIEHIGADLEVMKQVNHSLRPNSYFIISVPQFKFMWSYLDDMACHKRRYTRKEIRQKLDAAGFSIKYITSFVFFLFPVMWFGRLFKKNRKKTYNVNDQMKEIEIGPILNAICGFFTRMDELLIKAGISLPFGGSLIVVAQKNN
jgi:SAM-dependent methyltransferase